MVRRTAYGRPAVERETRVPVPVFDGPTARIAVGTSITRKIGMADSFEFIKVEVRVELPCLPNERDITETAEFANHMIEGLIGQAAPEPDYGPVVAVAIAPTRTPGTPIA
jgi:hypothetical protein